MKELRLKGISDIETANRFLEETYLPKMNRKFSRPASGDEDAHVALGEISLYPIMSMEFERTVGNNYVIRFEKRLF